MNLVNLLTEPFMSCKNNVSLYDASGKELIKKQSTFRILAEVRNGKFKKYATTDVAIVEYDSKGQASIAIHLK